MGKMFNIRFGRIRFGFYRGYIFESFFRYIYINHLTETLGCSCGLCAVDESPRAHWDKTEFIVFQHVLKF